MQYDSLEVGSVSTCSHEWTGGMAMVFIDITKVRSTSLGRLRCPARIKTFIQS